MNVLAVGSVFMPEGHTRAWCHLQLAQRRGRAVLSGPGTALYVSGGDFAGFAAELHVGGTAFAGGRPRLAEALVPILVAEWPRLEVVHVLTPNSVVFVVTRRSGRGFFSGELTLSYIFEPAETA